jgi:F-type H+-transporting ATPase subunit b
MIRLFAAEGPNKFFIPGDINELYWASAAFVVVFGALVWKVLPLFRNLLNNKADRIEAQLNSADEAQKKAAGELSELKARLGDADAEAARIVTEGHATAAKLRDDLKVRAASDVASMKERAAADIEAAKAKAQSDLQAEVAAATLSTAEELVRTNLDEASQVALIERYIEQVGASR